MRNNLQNMVLVAVLASFTGTATYAQQIPPIKQEVPVTPNGTPPPAEITPDHPITGPVTNGAAPRGSTTTGRADAKPHKDDLKRDREHER